MNIITCPSKLSVYFTHLGICSASDVIKVNSGLVDKLKIRCGSSSLWVLFSVLATSLIILSGTLYVKLNGDLNKQTQEETKSEISKPLVNKVKNKSEDVIRDVNNGDNSVSSDTRVKAISKSKSSSNSDNSKRTLASADDYDGIVTNEPTVAPKVLGTSTYYKDSKNKDKYEFDKNTYFYEDAQFNKDLNASDVKIDKKAKIEGELEVDDSVRFNDKLHVDDNLDLDGDLNSEGELNVDDGANISGALIVDSDSTFNNDVLIKGNLKVDHKIFVDEIDIKTDILFDKLLVDDGLQNILIGNNLNESLTTGMYNILLGSGAGKQMTTANNNVFLGVATGFNTTTGSDNVFVGTDTGKYNETGTHNTFLGRAAGYINQSGSNNVFVGSHAGRNSTGDNNTLVGTNAGYDITNGEKNTIIGNYTGLGLETGSSNTILGSNITGLASDLSNNILIGDGDGNIRIVADDTGNVGIGTLTPSYNLDVSGDIHFTGDEFVTKAITIPAGKYAFINPGFKAGYKASDICNNGTNIAKVARWDFDSDVYYSYTCNFGLGDFTISKGDVIQLLASSSGDASITAEFYANLDTGITTWIELNRLMLWSPDSTASSQSASFWVDDSDNLYINSYYGDLRMNSDDIFIENGTGNVGIGTTSPSTNLDVNGNARFRNVDSGTYAYDLNLTSDGTLTTASSDIRLKSNIKELDKSLDKVLKLNPVTFDWKDDPNRGRDIGLIAQEVEKLFPELTFTNPNDGYKGVNYSRLTVILTKALQEMQQEVNQESQKVQKLQKELNQKDAKLNEYDSRLRRLESLLCIDEECSNLPDYSRASKYNEEAENDDSGIVAGDSDYSGVEIVTGEENLRAGVGSVVNSNDRTDYLDTNQDDSDSFGIVPIEVE